MSNVSPLSVFLILIQFKANLTLSKFNLSSTYAYVRNFYLALQKADINPWKSKSEVILI